MTSLYYVIVASGRWVSTCHRLVPQFEMAFLLSGFQQSVSVTKDCWESGLQFHKKLIWAPRQLRARAQHWCWYSAHMSTHAHKPNQIVCSPGHTEAPVGCHLKRALLHVMCYVKFVLFFMWFNTLNWRLQQATACWQQQELIYNISVNAQHLKSIVITQNAVHRSDSPYAGLDSSHHKHVTLTAITSQSVKPPAEGQRWNLSRFSAGSTFSQPTKKQR